MIELRNISVSIGGRLLLEGCDATFVDGSVTALTGRNGSGKSTLLREMASLSDRHEGDILVDGISLKELTSTELARRVAVVGTQRIRIPNLSCREVTALGRVPYTNWRGRMGEKDREMVDKALELVGMETFAGRSMDRMSDGECQKIMIARALAQDTRNILLDEPNAFLDYRNRCEIGGLLASLAHDEGKCIIYSTHEIDLARRFCDRLVELSSCRLVQK